MQTDTLELMVAEIPEFLPITKQSGIEKAETYAAIFSPYMVIVKELSDKVKFINKETPSVTDAKIAREVRLALVKNRTATAKKKDESKANLIAEGNLIQNLHNVVISTSQLIEADLEAVEKFAENKEKERIEALRFERAHSLAPYVEDANIFPLGTMSVDAFTDLLTGSKLAHDARIEAARVAEENRIKEENAKLEEQKRIREENEKLKAEAEAKEKALQAEREEAAKLAKIEADKKAKDIAAIEEKNRIAREKAAKEQAIKDKATADELAKQKKQAEKLKAELKAKEDAEKLEADRIAKEDAIKLAAEKKAAKAPVKDKLKMAITALTLDLPHSEISADIAGKFNGFKFWALQQIEAI